MTRDNDDTPGESCVAYSQSPLAITAVLARQPQLVFDNSTPFDIANYVLNPHAGTDNPAVVCPFVRCQYTSA